MGDKQNEEEFRVAAIDGNSEELEKLLKKGVNVNKQWETWFRTDGWPGHVGNTALHFAVQYASEGHVNVVKTLLKHGARINIKNNRGQTALDVARLALAKFVRIRVTNPGQPHLFIHNGRADETWSVKIISILTLHPVHLVKQRLAFVHAMNNYNLDLDVLTKIGEMHRSLHK